MKPSTVSIDFSNTERAFQAKSDAVLRRTYRLFRMIDSPFLTKVGPPLLRFAFKIGLPIKGLVRKTLFDMFCGGESLAESVIASDYLDSFGVKTILDYSVEGENSKDGYDLTKQELLDAFHHGSKHSAVVFAACKITGLADTELLEKIQRGETLNETEQVWWERVRQRIDEVCAAAAESKTPIFIDAEESWFQNTIDQLAEEMMEKYNRETPMVYTTTQLYRHDRLAYLQELIIRAREKGYIPGIKIVRGAYLEKENDRAAEMGYPTPIQPNKAATDADYDAALAICLDHIDSVAICAGTHNEKSALTLTELMAAREIAPTHPHVWFAQLLGMSDHISFNLAPLGYNVAKYLPYGPVKAVMPYLMRRAEENTSVAGQASREVELLRKEVKRRRQIS